jgi:hypothetical protein
MKPEQEQQHESGSSSRHHCMILEQQQALRQLQPPEMQDSNEECSTGHLWQQGSLAAAFPRRNISIICSG